MNNFKVGDKNKQKNELKGQKRTKTQNKENIIELESKMAEINETN